MQKLIPATQKEVAVQYCSGDLRNANAHASQLEAFSLSKRTVASGCTVVVESGVRVRRFQRSRHLYLISHNHHEKHRDCFYLSWCGGLFLVSVYSDPSLIFRFALLRACNKWALSILVAYLCVRLVSVPKHHHRMTRPESLHYIGIRMRRYSKGNRTTELILLDKNTNSYHS